MLHTHTSNRRPSCGTVAGCNLKLQFFNDILVFDSDVVTSFGFAGCYLYPKTQLLTPHHHSAPYDPALEVGISEEAIIADIVDLLSRHLQESKEKCKIILI